MNAKERNEIIRAGTSMERMNENMRYWGEEFSGQSREWAIFTLSQGRYLGKRLSLEQTLILRGIARGDVI